MTEGFLNENCLFVSLIVCVKIHGRQKKLCLECEHSKDDFDSIGNMIEIERIFGNLNQTNV